MNLAVQIINSMIKIQENIFPRESQVTFDDVNLAEVHCIDRIGTVEWANVTKIANEMTMSRGAISKICKRLRNKGFIESYQRPDNNKEIYYRLTENGQHIFNEHKKLHHQVREEKLALINTYSEHEQSVILCFLNDINRLYDGMSMEDDHEQD